MNRGQPVRGLRVKVAQVEGTEGFQRFQFQAITDGNGFAEFRGLPAGSYAAVAEHNVSNDLGKGLVIKPNGPSNITISLNWPAPSPFKVRSLKGILRWDHPNPADSPKLDLELQEAVSGRVMNTSSTSGDGAFDFGDIASGLYFVRVKPFGLFPVEVDSLAKTDSLQLQLSLTTCGLQYTVVTQ